MKNLLNSVGKIDVVQSWKIKNVALLETLLSALEERKKIFPEASILYDIFKLLKQNKTIESLEATASPFLWAHIFRFICITDESRSGEFLNPIIMHVLDCYFEFLPKISILLNLKECGTVLLPNLGINIHLPSGESKIDKINQKEIVVYVNNKQEKTYKINYQEYRYNGIKVIHQDNGVSETVLFDKTFSSYIQDIENSIKDDSLKKAIDFIFLVDKNLMNDISALLKFIIPLKTTYKSSGKVSHSLTVEELRGLICTSFDIDPLWLAENIIHEYLHNLLFTFSEFFDIVQNNETLYYSPWRIDPRPLSGLFHAIFVFIGVLQFYSKCYKVGIDENGLTGSKIVHICYMVELAFEQVKNKDLTTKGIELMNEMRKKFINLFDDVFYDSKDILINVINHTEEWCAANAAIADCLIIPKRWASVLEEIKI